jgi:exosortase D (VPLPA-CTERM-specific)
LACAFGFVSAIIRAAFAAQWFESKEMKLFFISLTLLLFAYHPIMPELWINWQRDEYSHGVLIPLLAALLGWHRLAEKRPALLPSWWGVAWLVMAGLALLVGVLAAFPAAAHYGVIIGLVGLSLSFFGTAATCALIPAFVYLLFAVPLPHLVHTTLSQELQLLSSTIGVMVLELFHVPVFQEGNIIDLGGYKLQVVDACSGLRYLFPLMSFGFLIAYLLEDRFWKRAVLFLSSIPITIAMNSLRIAFIGVTVQIWGTRMAEGMVHELQGWVVFAASVAVLLAEGWLLMHLGNHKGRFRFEYMGLPRAKLSLALPSLSAPIVLATALCTLWALAFGTTLVNQRGEIRPEHPPFAHFPLQLDQWHGRSESLEPAILDSLNLSDYWLADYRHAEEKTPVNLYLAYYASQRVGSAAHSPADCIPGGGWRITDKSDKILANGMKITALTIQRGEAKQLVYYWFSARGRVLTESTHAKWYMMVDALTLRRTDGALVRLVTPLAAQDTRQQAEKRLEDFLSTALPAIDTFIPGKELNRP